MGGKNCIVVDSDADLDDAVPAIAYSAFGFAGQKCSACSRVLVHEALAEPLLQRLHGLLDTLTVDQATRFGVDVPPVIERESVERIEEHLARAGAAGATVVRGSGGPGGDGWFVAPTVVSGVAPDAEIAREELFGPVVVVEAVPTLDAALDVLHSLPTG
jgi:RHH-type proline utilization regulon transcriptional repressor/proline dehydrogenase/delta 1-pyrroline-5-carboxylate dehydrogenase